MSEMVIGAIAPWFGGKRTLAPDIVTELGEHGFYVEPFCGSMAVLLAKPPARMETVNDLNQDLINLARIIQDRKLCCDLYKRLRRVLFHEDMIEAAKGECLKSFEPSVERAFWYFLRSWIGRNGTAGTRETNQNFCRRFTLNGGGPGTRLQSAIASIPAWRRRLGPVQILNMDAFELVERMDDVESTAIYCDPPYLTKSAAYIHDFSDADHKRLAKLLRAKQQTRVVVSYYDDARLEQLYPGWTKRTFDVCKGMASGGRRGKVDVRATEVLLINGPSYAKSEDPLLFVGAP